MRNNDSDIGSGEHAKSHRDAVIPQGQCTEQFADHKIVQVPEPEVEGVNDADMLSKAEHPF